MSTFDGSLEMFFRRCWLDLTLLAYYHNDQDIDRGLLEQPNLLIVTIFVVVRLSIAIKRLVGNYDWSPFETIEQG